MVFCRNIVWNVFIDSSFGIKNMNPKKAKLIRKRTAELLTSIGISLGEGHGDYEQVNNCMSWEIATDKDGMIIRDPDGVQLLKPVKNPGTITHKWKYKVFYKWMKKMYKKGDAESKEIMEASTTQLAKMFTQPKENFNGTKHE